MALKILRCPGYCSVNVEKGSLDLTNLTEINGFLSVHFLDSSQVQPLREGKWLRVFSDFNCILKLKYVGVMILFFQKSI